MIERLGDKAGEITEAMRSHLEHFDTRIGGKTAEVTSVLDERFGRIEAAGNHVIERFGDKARDFTESMRTPL